MKRRSLPRFLIFAGLLFVAGGVLAACAPDTRAPTLQPRARPTDAEIAAQPTADTLRVALPPFTDTACLKCHTDQQQLTALAIPKEVEEGPSEGPG